MFLFKRTNSHSYPTFFHVPVVDQSHLSPTKRCLFDIPYLPDGAVGMEELSTLEAETLKDVMSAVQQLDLKMKN